MKAIIEYFSKKEVENLIKKSLEIENKEIYRQLDKFRERLNDIEQLTKLNIFKK